MFLLKKSIVIFVAILILNGCGGGSSSSGGGVSNGTPGSTPFAGTYSGSLRVSLSNDIVTVSDRFFGRLTISNNGRVEVVSDDVEAEGEVCIGFKARFINGNRIPLDARGSCFFPGLGVCKIALKGSATVSGASIVGVSTGSLICPAPTGAFSLRFDYGFTRI